MGIWNGGLRATPLAWSCKSEFVLTAPAGRSYTIGAARVAAQGFCEEGEVMKLLSALLFVAAAIALTGCTLNTPAYSAKERFAQVNRNVAYQSAAFNDDWDYVTMFRPSNQETIWNVYHR